MKLKKLDLPKKYEYKEGVSRKEFKKYNGIAKLSYSQYTSFKDFENNGYRGSYIAEYIIGLPKESNIFADYGSVCGTYLETGERGELSDSDIEILDRFKKDKDAVYEREIVVPLFDYGVSVVVQGFEDYFLDKSCLTVIDFKTGGENKKEFYGSDNYGQTQLYSHFETTIGGNVCKSGVVLFPRKGNGSEKHPLRLEGDPIYIDTPYCSKKADLLLKDMAETAIKISEYNKVYKRYFK